MSDQKGMYAGFVPETERRRLAAFEYPNEVSRHILSDLQFGSLIDAAAGPGTSIAEYVVRERNASYTAFDLNPDFVKTLNRGLKEKGIAAKVFEADVLDIPAKVGHADIVHSRFLLMHISSDEERRKALGGLLSIADQLVLLEYDWKTMKAYHHKTMDIFKECAYELMDALHVDPFAGTTMKDLVRDSMPEDRYEFVHNQHFGVDSEELIELCRTQSDFAMKLGMSDLAGKFIGIAADITASNFVFAPPEITIAIIRA